MAGWSPRVRGWSYGRHGEQRVAFVVPARAGVVPVLIGGQEHQVSGPRACGGGPMAWMSSHGMGRWSPRVRGWSPAGLLGSEDAGVVPARAGVVPPGHPPTAKQTGGPRACGGGPNPWFLLCELCGWSPRVRGWSRSAPHDRMYVGVVPARAGVVPAETGCTPRCPGGPRACGGGPTLRLPRMGSLMWSPRVRGWSQRSARICGRAPVVPARAGVVPRFSWRRRSWRRGPRACGGGPGNSLRVSGGLLWSPRVRGWPRGDDDPYLPAPVVPAYARDPRLARLLGPEPRASRPVRSLFLVYGYGRGPKLGLRGAGVGTRGPGFERLL